MTVYDTYKIIEHLRNDYYDKLPEKIHSGIKKSELKKILYDKLPNIINDKNLNLLNKRVISRLRDTKDKSYFFFRNGFVVVTFGSINLFPYEQLEKPIWDTQIIDRDIDLTKMELNHLSKFCQFTKNICTNNGIFEETRHNALISSIGYLLNNYNAPDHARAIIYSENNPDINSSSGGTGKGLIMQAIKQLRNVVIRDGKKINISQFKNQDVNEDTDLIFWDDITANFDLESLFSEITEGIIIEKKFQTAKHIPICWSPKFVITTNYVVRLNSNSANRRKVEIELCSFYNKSHTPKDDFGSMFSEEWSEEEWNYLYCFMFYCVQSYFKNGLIEYQSDSFIERKLNGIDGEDFNAFMN